MPSRKMSGASWKHSNRAVAMPNRILRDGILMSPRVNVLSSEAELFYRRLMSVVDDYGRFSAHPTFASDAVLST